MVGTPSSGVAELLAPLLGHGPANQALALGLRSLVLDGRLVVGARVPSERDLARELGLSRATVTAAYERLRQQGFLVSDRGGGTRVSLADRPTSRPDEPSGPPADYDLTIAALPAPGVLPQLVGEAGDRLSPYLAGHGLSPLGLRELREAIAERYTVRGLPTSAEEVLVTQGALHGWDIVVRAHAKAGSVVAVEQPTYPAVLDAARAHRVRLTAIPTGADGWDLAGQPLGRAPDVVLVTPDFQNPTGLLASTAARRRLLRCFPDALIVADETFTELDLDGGPAPLPMAALAPARTLTLGSLSKPVWAGLRIGWVRGPAPLLQGLATARTHQDLGSPVLDQLLALCALEQLDDILTERRRTLLVRRDALLADLATLLPQWSVRRPAGGLVLWADLGSGQSSARLALVARDRGVRLTPGSRFALAATHDQFLRLPYTLPPELSREALTRLADVAALVQDRPSADRPALVWTA